MTNPTPTQTTTLAVIASLTLIHGRAPTLRQLAETLGVGKQAVYHRLGWMRKKGLLSVNHGRWSRASRLTREGVATVSLRLRRADSV